MLWAWTFLLLVPAAGLLVVRQMPPWQAMCCLTVATLAGCKAATWALVDSRQASWLRRAGYWLAWPGMDAAAFLFAPRERVVRPRIDEWLQGAAMTAAGALVIWGVVPWLAPLPELAAWAAMAGLLLVGHFGLLELLSCAWRSAGVLARPLMDQPWRAASLTDFWGRRWNTAFRDLAHRLVLLPMARRFGPTSGVIAVFVFSGLVHDLVISVPARGGYGLPTLYFVIQALGMLGQRTALARALGAHSGWGGWAVTMLVVLAPAGLLFHQPWRVNVILPLMEALGAL